MNENLFLKGFENGVSGKKINAKEIKNIRFSKSQLFVQWQTESGNTCDECRNRDKRIFAIDEIEGIMPFHYNCRCKFVTLPSVTILSSNVNSFIMGSETGRKHIISRCEEYDGDTSKLPQEKNRKYYAFTDSDNRKYVISNDGLCFLVYKNNFYPVESKEIAESIVKKQEEEYIKKFKPEMELFENNEIAPMAYTYIMQNIYDWYIADDAAKRAEITEKLAEFKRSKYKYTGIKFYDDGIKYLPELPHFWEIDSKIHYFRNNLNVECSWADFQKLNKRLPEGYKWKQMTPPTDAMHQNTAPNTTTMRNKKYVSADGYFEAVYSYDGKLLNEGVADIDMGTYNYAPSTKGGFYMIYHLFKDMITYDVYKNSKKDLNDYLNNFSKNYERIESK